MSSRVKAGGATRLSAKNQVTIPIAVLAGTGLRTGDQILVSGDGPGRIVLTRVDDLVAEYAGALTGRLAAGILAELDDEWD